MTITEQDRDVDKKLAGIVNDMEDLQLEKCTQLNTKDMGRLIAKLNFCAVENKCHIERIKIHRDELWDVLQGTNTWYLEANKPSVYNRLNHLYLPPI